MTAVETSDCFFNLIKIIQRFGFVLQPHLYPYCDTPDMCSVLCVFHSLLMFMLLLLWSEHVIHPLQEDSRALGKVCVYCVGAVGMFGESRETVSFLGVSLRESQYACYSTTTKILAFHQKINFR